MFQRTIIQPFPYLQELLNWRLLQDLNWVKSCKICFQLRVHSANSAIAEQIIFIAVFLFDQIQTGQTGGQSYADTSP